VPHKDAATRNAYIHAKNLADPVFHEKRKEYWRNYAKANRPAINETKRKWRELRKECRTPEDLRELRKRYRREYYAYKSKVPEYNKKHTAYAKRFRAKLKAKILEAYGAVCVCCGESMPEFLTPDHINGGGSQHLKRRGTQGIYLDIIKEGFPKDKYRILCMNCNWGRSVYGVCPHASAGR
jgi:hypothetical protein